MAQTIDMTGKVPVVTGGMATTIAQHIGTPAD